MSKTQPHFHAYLGGNPPPRLRKEYETKKIY
uniref:Uncharacterized protein n=1 Tax=Podoviridae sp. ctefc32 TaxID=2827742 RepID=A0A8S5T236_9CAUD|nr:MAG TPA: hypothetical protein [Podoviridae sp. ctefc32]DAK38433.1 MAG TPA: hypothetical protein [Caudoviricetes sp.]